MSDIRFNCQFCNQPLEAPSDMAGTQVACPGCDQAINVPNTLVIMKPRWLLVQKWGGTVASLFGIFCLLFSVMWYFHRGNIEKYDWDDAIADVQKQAQLEKNSDDKKALAKLMMFLVLYKSVGLMDLTDVKNRDSKLRFAVDEETVLMLATEFGNPKIVNLLLEKGANVNETKGLKNVVIKGSNVLEIIDLHYPPIGIAAVRGHTEVLRLLIDKGAIIDAQRENGDTALMLAVSAGKIDCIRFLIEKGANIEARSLNHWNSLNYAIDSGNIPVLRLLIEKGANVNAQDKEDLPPLIDAAMCGADEATKLLVKKVTNINERDSYGFTALDYAAMKGYTTTLSILIENGANINQKQENELTALMSAATKGKIACARLLLEKGSDVEARGPEGVTPLIIAARYGHLELVQFLIDKGANVNAKTPVGFTPLLSAIVSDQAEIVNLLIQKGADIKDEDKNGDNVMNRAIYHFYQPGINTNKATEILKLLNDAGAVPCASIKFREFSKTH